MRYWTYVIISSIGLAICLTVYLWPNNYKVSLVNMEEWQKQHERCRSGPTVIEVFVHSGQKLSECVD